MYSFNLIFAAMLLALNGASAAACPAKTFTCVPGKHITPKDQAINFSNFVQTFYVEKDVSRAFMEHALESYIQHNPLMVSGREQTIDFLGAAISDWNITIKHQGFQNNIGWVHWKLEGFGTARYNAVVDVFRYEGGCVAEHWDAVQPVPEPRVNPLEMF